MPNYKVTVMINHSTMGYSETYYTKSESPPAAAADIQKMVGFRRIALWQDEQIVGVRVSLSQTGLSSLGNNRQSVLLLPGTATFLDGVSTVAYNAAGNQTQQLVETGAYQEAPTAVALQTRLFYAGNRAVTRYYAAPSRELLGTEPQNFYLDLNDLWLNALNGFLQNLVSAGWGIVAQDIATPALQAYIRGFVYPTSPLNLLGLIVPISQGQSFPPGSTLYVQGTRPPKGTRYPTINGKWTINSVTQPVNGVITIYLDNSGAILPNSLRYTAQSFVRLRSMIFQPITAFQFLRIGTHRRGRPLLAPRGRRLMRPTLDP